MGIFYMVLKNRFLLVFVLAKFCFCSKIPCNDYLYLIDCPEYIDTMKNRPEGFNFID